MNKGPETLVALAFKKINELRLSGIVIHDPILEMSRINDIKEFSNI
mgnify:CR=1 FL=1